MLIDERLEVETPEGAMLSLSLAGPVPRALAYAIDLAIRLVIYGALAAVFAALGKAGMGLLLIMAFVLEWFYPTLFEAFRHGQTPGKKAMGLVVVHANGSPLSFNGSLIRNLLRTADAFPLFYLLGFICTLISPRYQRLGDMAANTLVVHIEETPQIQEQAQGDTLAPDWSLNRDDQLALLAFHERHDRFSEARQQELAQLAYPELAPALALQRLNAVSRYLVQGAHMKQARFEQQYRPEWQALERQLEQLESLHVSKKNKLTLDTFVTDYRKLCHQLALARERGYSVQLQQFLNNLVLRAHRQLYRYNPSLADRIGTFIASGFPQAVRRQWRWHLVSALAFVLSMALVWVLVHQQPEMIYTVVDEASITNLESMYQPENQADMKNERSGDDDVMMFGHYIQNNIGIAFRTFASGLLLGVGALVVMLFNGSFFGAAAGHLINVGAQEPFFTFVIAHGAPELTAIVLAGGAGLRLGWAIIAPGPWSRLDALRLAAKDALPTMYGVFALLLLAAFIEAFWSPRDLAPTIKYSVGAACWALLYLYLFFGGRDGTRKG